VNGLKYPGISPLIDLVINSIDDLRGILVYIDNDRDNLRTSEIFDNNSLSLFN
jgi:hypothetical protein